MKSFAVVLALTTGCLPVLDVPPPNTPPAEVAQCKGDATVHGVGVVGAATGAAASIGFAFAALEVPATGNTPQVLSDVGLIAGGVGLLAVGLVALGALDYAADGCAGVTGPLPAEKKQ